MCWLLSTLEVHQVWLMVANDTTQQQPLLMGNSRSHCKTGVTVKLSHWQQHRFTQSSKIDKQLQLPHAHLNRRHNTVVDDVSVWTWLSMNTNELYTEPCHVTKFVLSLYYIRPAWDSAWPELQTIWGSSYALRVAGLLCRFTHRNLIMIEHEHKWAIYRFMSCHKACAI